VQQEQPSGEPWTKRTVTLGRADFIRFGRACALRRSWVVLLLLALIIPASAAFATLIDGRVRDKGALIAEIMTDPTLWTYVAAMAGVLLTYFALVVPWLQWRRGREDKTLAGQIDLAFYENGVASHNRIGDAFYPWTIFSRADRTGPLVHMWLGKAKAILIPLGAVGDAKNLQAQCAARIAAAKNSVTTKS